MILSGLSPLLRMPLVRHQQRLTIGDAEPTWREWTGR